MTEVNQIQWHNKRYTPEEIAKIQVALNRLALGKLITVSGKIDLDTIDAIKNFLTLHLDILKIDGLAGDQTLSAMGVNIGDASLTATRRGLYQGRTSYLSPAKGVRKSADDQARAYYNSPEMLSYLMNATNAITDPLYYNHYQNALRYVSPEIASKLRALNDEGDAYDNEVSANRGQSYKRRVGILEAKNAIANGQLRTAEQIDKWAKEHNLSKEEMQEILTDPAAVQVSLVDATRLDNGRVVRHENMYGVLNHVTNEMHDAGVNYALPGMMAIPSLATAPVAMVGSALGGTGVNYGVQLASNGLYGSWGLFVADKTGTLDKQWAWEFTNPGAIIGGLAGGAVEGYTPGHKAVRMKVANPRAGETYVSPNGKVPVLTGTLVTEVSSGGGNSVVVPGKVTGGFNQSTSPIFEMREIPGMVKRRPATVSKIIAPATKSELNPTFYDQWQSYSNSNTQAPMLLEVPTYDQGVTYAPYQGFNRVLFKTGGKLNYLQYIK